MPPLAGVKVLELARVLAGPVCAQVLADLGADVVKVERPGVGDETRQWGPPFLPADAATGEKLGPSAYYLSCNRGKRSLALDFSTSDGRRVLDDLLRKADVLVENFLPASLEKLGLTPERLHELNPRLVVVSISGYGRTGPLADKPGYDLVVQATGGIMSITGPPDGPPMKIGVAITDVITGLYGAISALAGLQALSRQPTARAATFDLALVDCTLASLVNVAQGALLTGRRPERLGNAHPHIVPYEAFATRDGYMVLAVGNDAQFARFCGAAGESFAGDERFATNPNRVRNRAALIPLVERVMRSRTTSEWEKLLTEADVPHAPVQSLDEIFAQPQTAARHMADEAQDSAGRRFPLLGSAIKRDHGEPLASGRLPPALGEHSDEVLRDWLGYADGQIATLRRSGAVG
jgi:crotonobetainyl-CoA:carnitine CoA-transferase CaiB-like acyl-CoA transferase